MDPSAAALAYLKFVLQELDCSPSALAKSAGISSSTLTRPLNSPDHKYSISTSTISKIAAVSGINPGPFFESTDVVARTLAIKKESDDAREKYRDENFDTSKIDYLPIIGELSPGDFRENRDLGWSYYGIKFVTILNRPREEVFGVYVRGSCADMIASDGEVLLCERRHSLPDPMSSSVAVIIEKTTAGGSLIELSACVPQRRGKEWILRNASKDPIFDMEIPVSELSRSDQNVKVIGIVRYVVREAWQQMSN